MRAFVCFILIALASITEGALSLYGIKGGRNAPIDKFPYQVSLRLNNTYLCSGSILDNFNVLTTANCIVGRGMQCNKELKVHVGTNNLDAPGYVYDITTITVHSNYDTKLYNNDIALVHLKYSITYNKLVQPVKLPTSNEGLEGQPCTLSGWGSSDDNTDKTLQEIEAVVYSQYECQKEYWYVTDRHICISWPKDNIGTCGDYGSPLVVNGAQIGIVSQHYFVNCYKNPDALTRVSSFLPWIAANLKT